MTVSEKQLKANRKNAKKAGVKTAEGKAIVKYNALMPNGMGWSYCGNVLYSQV